jgi:2-dehydropantoate 2-reductase
MHYFIFGTGAVGGLLGTRLALADHPVTFLARPRLAKRLQRYGMRLTGEGSSGWLQHATVVSKPEPELQTNPPDVILLTVKAYDCLEAAKTLQRSLAGRSIPVVSLFNGVNNEQTLSENIGQENVIPATLTTAVQMVEPGVFQVERERGLGLASCHPLADTLQRELSAAGIKIRRYADSTNMKWSKLMTNIVTNASSAILGWPPGLVFGHKGVAKLEIQALREALRVMRRLKVRPVNLPGVPIALLGRALVLPAAVLRPVLAHIVTSGRGDKLPSFNYDVGRGRSEVTYLNGAVVRAGEDLGVATPANRILTNVLLGLVSGETSPDTFQNQPERLLEMGRSAGVPGV